MNGVVYSQSEELAPWVGGQLDAENLVAIQGKIGHSPQAHADEQSDYGKGGDGGGTKLCGL